MKTSELTGAALNWAVAKCEGDDTLAVYFDERSGEPLCHDDWPDNQEFKPSTDWAQGGPIVEREKIGFRFSGGFGFCAWKSYGVGSHQNEHSQYGTTPLIAAMRCYVASKLGDEVEVPEELGAAA
jgi:hypothetical protein